MGITAALPVPPSPTHIFTPPVTPSPVPHSPSATSWPSVPTPAIIDEDLLKSLVYKDRDPIYILGPCKGDCDENTSFMHGLICFKRVIKNATVFVPGCAGTPLDMDTTDHRVDYCVDPYAPSLPPTFIDADEVVLVYVGGDHVYNFERCQGNCNTDDDCTDDLKCFYRGWDTFLSPIPGCKGKTFWITNYRILPFEIVHVPSIDPTVSLSSVPTVVASVEESSVPSTHPSLTQTMIHSLPPTMSIGPSMKPTNSPKSLKSEKAAHPKHSKQSYYSSLSRNHHKSFKSGKSAKQKYSN